MSTLISRLLLLGTAGAVTYLIKSGKAMSLIEQITRKGKTDSAPSENTTNEDILAAARIKMKQTGQH